MKRNNHILVSLLMTGFLMTVPYAKAADQPDSYMTGSSKATRFVQTNHTETYGETVGRKLTSSLANLTTSTLEIPKTIINISNQSNVAWGFGGGVIEGTINTIGRIGVGILDLITAPLPTKPIVYPLYVWDDFDAKTTYGPVFRLKNGD
jgi:putative exosortase-associated protein (TIGR04073 family)